MPGRAKGKRFVIRGKERLDVGFQEDEFLLQAVFYCMGAGPNPDCRAPMLAPRRRQNLITPSGHANRSAQIPPAGRPCWRCPAGKALSLRRQSLIPPPGHANRPARILPAGRPCWRLAAGKALSHRRATPTVRLKSRPAAAHVGAAPSAKPYPTAGPRQQAGPNPACRPPMLAPLRRQNLIPPPGRANRLAQIPPSGRPCWRGQAPPRLLFMRKFINQPFSFTS